jgi:hypothetical protein
LKEYYIHEKTGVGIASAQEPGAIAILRKDQSHA